MSAEAFVEKVKAKLAVKNFLIRCMLSEFFGTFLLVLLADGAIAGMLISSTEFNHMWVASGVGLAVTFGIWAAFGVSGGHVNPAVSLGLAVTGKFSFKSLPWYCLAQFAGAFFGGLVCYCTYFEGITEMDKIRNSTCGIFTSFPAAHAGYGTAILDQIVTTGLLVGLILLLVDKRNAAPDASLVPFFACLLVVSIILSYGANTGAPLNPARDLTGRIICSIANISPSAWIVNGDHWYWLVPTFGPLIGSVVGVWMYMLFIEIHHPREAQGNDEDDPHREIEYQKIPKRKDDENFNLTINPEKAVHETKLAES